MLLHDLQNLITQMESEIKSLNKELSEISSVKQRLEAENVQQRKQVDIWKAHLSDFQHWRTESAVDSQDQMREELDLLMRSYHQRSLRCEELTLEVTRVSKN